MWSPFKLLGAIFIFNSVRSSFSASFADDPCAIVANQSYSLPADALACYKAFPFNETLRQNVLTAVSRVFDFYTFEDYYLNSPPPFQESTTDIRATLDKINLTDYATDYDFNKALYDFIHQLNDGHTLWLPSCYLSWASILPTPLISLEVDGVQSVYVTPDSVDVISGFGPEYTGYYTDIGFDWKRLAGAKVISIEDQDPYSYVDNIAKTETGTYLDHGIRVNSVFASYTYSFGSYATILGDIALTWDLTRSSLKLALITVNSTETETVSVPYYSFFVGGPANSKDEYWANNCVATPFTNWPSSENGPVPSPPKPVPRRPIASKANIIPILAPLPPSSTPNLTQTSSSNSGAIQSYFLPGNKTGVMYVTTFGADFDSFQADAVAAIQDFKAAGVTRLMVDLTNNGGGIVCLGLFLFQLLAGAKVGYPGFQSTNRGNELAQKIVASDIAQGLDKSDSFYTADNYNFLNGTPMPSSYDYMSPVVPFTVNGRSDPTSQRYQDSCSSQFSQTIPDEPAFSPQNIAIVGDGLCASTCALFSTLMYERLNTTFAIFGGKPGETMQYKGMAGNQVLEWLDLNYEIKTAKLEDDPLAPPDLLVNANLRHNWRTAWSYSDEQSPIAYVSELPQHQFPFTPDTYNNPQNLWIFSESKLFD